MLTGHDRVIVVWLWQTKAVAVLTIKHVLDQKYKKRRLQKKKNFLPLKMFMNLLQRETKENWHDYAEDN